MRQITAEPAAGGRKPWVTVEHGHLYIDGSADDAIKLIAREKSNISRAARRRGVKAWIIVRPMLYLDRRVEPCTYNFFLLRTAVYVHEAQLIRPILPGAKAGKAFAVTMRNNKLNVAGYLGGLMPAFSVDKLWAAGERLKLNYLKTIRKRRSIELVGPNCRREHGKN